MVSLPVKKTKTNAKILTNKYCLKRVTQSCAKHLPLQIHGTLTPSLFYNHLISLSLNRSSIHSARKTFQKFRSETTLHYHLKKFDMTTLIDQSFELLWSTAAPILSPKKSYEFAIDYTHDPYYGDIDEKNEGYIIKAQRKKSTYKFYTYATLSVVTKNEKLVLGVLPVQKGHGVEEYVGKLVESLERHQIKPKVIYLDGGFYGRPVMKLLMEKEMPFIIPMPNKKGKIRNIIQTSKKKTVLPYMIGEHTSNKLTITMGIIVKRPPKEGKRVKDKYSYAFYGVEHWGISKISRMYEHRFSIEASYRIRNEIKPKTSTKNPVVRYLFALIAFVIENIWVSLQNTCFVLLQRGPKVIDEDSFPLKVFVTLANTELMRILGEIRWISRLR